MITAAHRINKQTTIAVVRPWPAITAAALTATVMPGFAVGAMATPIAACACSALLRDAPPRPAMCITGQAVRRSGRRGGSGSWRSWRAG
jgi:hypothetical protein